MVDNQLDMFSLRQCCSAEMELINQILVDAIQTWQLADRVIRLTVPLLKYEIEDFKLMQFTLASDEAGKACGFISWHLPEPQKNDENVALNLHGLYVRPSDQSRRLGQQLLQHAEDYARSRNYNRINLKAWRDTETYFRKLGYLDIDSAVEEKLYPLPLTKKLD